MATNSKAVLIASAIASFVGFGAATLIDRKINKECESTVEEALSTIKNAEDALAKLQETVNTQSEIIEHQKATIELMELKEKFEKEKKEHGDDFKKKVERLKMTADKLTQ